MDQDLVRGRSWLLGTSEKAKFCPALSLSHLLIQIDPIYVLAHIIIGEFLLSKSTQRPLRKAYYKRRAEIYKETNTILLDQDISVHRKMWTLIQLAMLEATARRSDLQAIHIKALDEFVESMGGITAAFSHDQEDVFTHASARLYAGPLVRTPIPIRFVPQLNRVKDRFFACMSSIQEWISTFRIWISVTDLAEFRSYTVSNRQLDMLTNYLRNLVRKWRAAEVMSTSLETNSGALICGLSLARTFVECNSSPAMAFNFLYEVQESLSCSVMTSTRPEHGLDDLHPAAAAYGMSCIRSKLFTDKKGHSREARISQALSDAHKIFLLLSVTRRIEIVEWLMASVQMVAALACDDQPLKKHISTCFEGEQLQALEDEIERACVTTDTVDEC